MSTPYPTSRDELLTSISTEHAALVQLVQGFAAEDRTQPLVDEQSLKDIIAHISDWQNYFLRRMRAAAMGESLPYRSAGGKTADDVNAEIYITNRDRTWEDVWREFEQSYAEIFLELQYIDEAALLDPTRAMEVLGMPREVAPMEEIMDHTAGHYREHIDDIHLRLG